MERKRRSARECENQGVTEWCVLWVFLFSYPRHEASEAGNLTTSLCANKQIKCVDKQPRKKQPRDSKTVASLLQPNTDDMVALCPPVPGTTEWGE